MVTPVLACASRVTQVDKLDTIGNAAVKSTELASRCRQLQILVAGLGYPMLGGLTGPADLPGVKNVSGVLVPAVKCGMHRCLWPLLLHCVTDPVAC